MTKEEIKAQRDTIREILENTIADMEKAHGLSQSVIASEFLATTTELCLQTGGYLGACEAFAKVQQVLIQGAADLWIKEGKNGDKKPE